jgi:N-formylglutamate deformylase
VSPGSPESGVILHVPHSSRTIPPVVRERILLDDAALGTELDRMTDAHTDVIAEAAAALAAHRPGLLVNATSRLVVDPERFPDDREELRAVGMGAVYTRTSHGAPLRADDPAHADWLLRTYFEPYAAAMAALTGARLAATGTAVILDVHSYPRDPLPYELRPTAPRPAICLGTDPFHTPAALLAAAREAFAPCGPVAVDTPFAGCYVPLRYYGREPAVRSLMVEIRRDLDGAGVERVARALAGLIDRLTPAPPRAGGAGSRR